MKVKEINTPCGFQIILIRHDDGGIGISSYFGGNSMHLTNSNLRLSPEGARMLGQGLIEMADE